MDITISVLITIVIMDIIVVITTAIADSPKNCKLVVSACLVQAETKSLAVFASTLLTDLQPSNIVVFLFTFVFFPFRLQVLRLIPLTLLQALAQDSIILLHECLHETSPVARRPRQRR